MNVSSPAFLPVVIARLRAAGLALRGQGVTVQVRAGNVTAQRFGLDAAADVPQLVALEWMLERELHELRSHVAAHVPARDLERVRELMRRQARKGVRIA